MPMHKEVRPHRSYARLRPRLQQTDGAPTTVVLVGCWPCVLAVVGVQARCERCARPSACSGKRRRQVSPDNVGPVGLEPTTNRL